MPGPITAGIDGTEESLAALGWAAREAVLVLLTPQGAAYGYRRTGDGSDSSQDIQ